MAPTFEDYEEDVIAKLSQAAIKRLRSRSALKKPKTNNAPTTGLSSPKFALGGPETMAPLSRRTPATTGFSKAKLTLTVHPPRECSKVLKQRQLRQALTGSLVNVSTLLSHNSCALTTSDHWTVSIYAPSATLPVASDGST